MEGNDASSTSMLPLRSPHRHSVSWPAEASVPGDSSLPPWSGRVLGLLASLWSPSLEELKLSFTWKQAADAWVLVRANVVAPVLQVAVALCMLMSVMLVSEKILMGATSLFAKLFRWRPQRRYKYHSMGEDMEVGYPMVLVQIPMYNEKQVRPFLLSLTLRVYKLSIGAACGLSWPMDRIIIQVLDDSTDPEIKVEQESGSTMHSFFGFNVFVPEIEVSTWGVVYIPTTITLLNSVGTPRSGPYAFSTDAFCS
ncbi:hypothetical protein GW17_00017465 [Ensete ventricosum]|nr:hypothetical protein GW17_00017465 [Ensete ventricosum]